MPDSICNLTWSAVAAVAAWLTAVIVFWQVRQESKLSRMAMGVESLLRLLESWDSPRFVRIRRQAAKALLEEKPDENVDTILDWFETVALLVRRGGLDEEFTWHTFYWWIAHYWYAARDYIREVQQEEGPATWKDLGSLMSRLYVHEARASNLTSAEVAPSAAELREFLASESSLSEIL
jgi:hypothetical protein